MIINSPEELDAWFIAAEPGDVGVYGVATEHRRPLHYMLQHANGYLERNLVQLFQKRQPNGSLHYLIRKAGK